MLDFLQKYLSIGFGCKQKTFLNPRNNQSRSILRPSLSFSQPFPLTRHPLHLVALRGGIPARVNFGVFLHTLAAFVDFGGVVRRTHDNGVAGTASVAGKRCPRDVEVVDADVCNQIP